MFRWCRKATWSVRGSQTIEKRNGMRKNLTTEFSILIATLIVVFKMKKGVLFVMAAALILLMGHSKAVWADPVTLTLDDLDLFTLVAEDDPEGTPVLTVSGAATTTLRFTGYTVVFAARASSSTDFVTVDIGLTGQSLDWTTFDSLVINLENTDENVWGFGLFIKDGPTGGVVSGSSGQTSLTENGSVRLILDLTTLPAGFDLSDIDEVGIRLTADFSVLAPLGDSAAEFHASVPEPASLFLLGFGLAGLGFFRERKRVA